MAADARGAPKEDVPLPRPRPTDLHGPNSPLPEDGKSDAHEKPARDEGCLERLKADGFTFEPATPPWSRSGLNDARTSIPTPSFRPFLRPESSFPRSWGWCWAPAPRRTYSIVA